MRGIRKVSGWTVAALMVLSFCFLAWASSIGEYAGGTEVWGITELSGDLEVFCSHESILLDVRRLDIQSVTWTDLGNEVSGVAVRTLGDDSVVADFTLPGG